MIKITESIIKDFNTNSHYSHMAQNLITSDSLEAMTIECDEWGVYTVKAIIDDDRETIKFSMNFDNIGFVWNYKSNQYVFRPEKVYALFLLKMIQKLAPDKVPFKYASPNYLKVLERNRLRKTQESSALINHYKSKAKRELIENIITGNHQIVAYLNNGKSGLSVRFRISTPGGTPYLIKNIQTFLNDINRSAYLTFGQKLSLKMEENNFDEPSKQIIGFARKLINMQISSEYKSNFKELELTNGVIDEFFDLFTKIPSHYTDFKLAETVDKPIILIEKTTSYYRISLKTKYRYTLGLNHLYHIDDNVKKLLLKTNLDTSGKTVSLIYRLSRQKEFIVSYKDFNDFYTYVLSDIKDYISIEGYENKLLTESEINIYADIDEADQVFTKIEYKYETEETQPGLSLKTQNISLNAHKVESYIENYAEVDNENEIAIIKKDSYITSEFVKVVLPYLQQYANVYVSEALKQLGNKRRIQLSAGITIKNDLLNIDLDSVDIPREELAAVLTSYRRKRKFHKLKNGERLHLEADELEEIDNLLTAYNVDLKSIKDGQMKLDLYRAFSLNALAENESSLIEINRSEAFKDIINRFENIEHSRSKLSKKYENLLREYQKYGVYWMQTLSSFGFGGILADDMGLGKTLQVISLLDEYKQKDGISIVITPASLILNWEDEINKFSSGFRALSIYGSAPIRHELIKDIKNYDLIITSYDYIRRDVELYQDVQFEFVILDEAQYIKNQSTKNAQSVKMLNGKNKLALTGTPIENSLAELWSIFDFLMPGYLFPYAYFAREYERPIIKETDEIKHAELKRLISPFILRRRKKDVLKELPDKIESTVTIDFKEEERKLYLANLSQVNAELQNKLELEQANAIAILAMLTRLRQICCEPRVLYENIKTPSSKVEACMELVNQLVNNDKKVLIFSSFTSVLDLLNDALSREGISHFTLTGATDKVKRRELVDKFQKDDTSVFLISLKAGGTGLNLTAAEAVIHFDPWWNMSAQNQATDRAHRIGQTSTVQVFKLIMKNSIEEKIQLLQEAKKDLADAFVEGNDGRITNMSKEEIMDLFKN